MPIAVFDRQRRNNMLARGWLRRLLAVCLPAVLLMPFPAVGANGCAEAAGGGEWRSFNRDLTNSRHQSDESLIGPQNVAALSAKWAFTLPVGTGTIESTPAVVDGCVYLLTFAGYLYALNADTGDILWRVRLSGAAGSPTVQGGRIYVNVNSQPRTTVALDQETGGILWRTAWDQQPGAMFFASPVVFNGMVLTALSGLVAEEGNLLIGDERLQFRGSYALLDAVTGALLKKDFVIPDEDFARGFAGGGLLATPAVDLETGYAYEGTGNPFSAAEHQNTNAIVKIDVDPSRPTFGGIVGSYHGTIDQYLPPLTDKPACEALVAYATCELLDLDFGASPQLFTDSTGRKLVGDHQKSGVYHAADASSMGGVWNTVVGIPWVLGGVATASYDGRDVFVAASNGQLMALDKDAGSRRWVIPNVDWQTSPAGTMHSQPVTTANGVTYGVDGKGVFYAIDSLTGMPLLLRPLVLDAGSHSSSPGAGIAIARHTVYVPDGRNFVAYGLPS
jgi:outer membrane protein assembly factor BamB